MRRRLALVLVGLAACKVGTVLALTDGGGGGGGDDDAPMAPGSNCPVANPATAGAGGHAANGVASTDTSAPSLTAHEGCMINAGCHNANNTPTGGAWDYGGEAFMDGSGTMPYAGATILLYDGTLYQQVPVLANGFFYAFAGEFTPPSTTMPIMAWLCDGSNMTPMTQALSTMDPNHGTTDSTDGNCNATACHGPGGSGGFIYPTM